MSTQSTDGTLPLTAPQPSVIGRYELLEELGRGGMGIVYKARDPLLERLVAIKVLSPALQVDDDLLARFSREATVSASLNRHPHIVNVYDMGEAGGNRYLVMEYVEGMSLAESLRRVPVWPADKAAAIIAQAASALDYAHGEGIIHRDIKPHNLLLDSSGYVKITDFGLARALQQSHLTPEGRLMGTPDYLSPEQARGLPADARTDVYSLGVVLYQMLSGTVPFRADTLWGVVVQHIQAPPPPLRQLHPEIPPGVEAVVEKALAKDPAQRYARPGDLAQALYHALAPSAAVAEPASQPPAPIAAVPAPQPVAAAPSAPPSARPRRGIGPVAFMVVLLLLGLGAFLLPKVYPPAGAWMRALPFLHQQSVQEKGSGGNAPTPGTKPVGEKRESPKTSTPPAAKTSPTPAATHRLDPKVAIAARAHVEVLRAWVDAHAKVAGQAWKRLLQQATQDLDAGNAAAAIATLRAFESLVEAADSADQLSDRDADWLEEHADAAIDALEGV